VPRRAPLLAWLLPLFLVVATAAQGVERHFLWQVPGERNTVHLLGSIHALRSGDYPVAPVIDRAFREAEAVVLEIRIPQGGTGATAAQLGNARGPGLKAQLTEAQYRQARGLAEAQGIDLEALSGLDPWLAGLVITQGAMRRAGYDPGQGLDAHFQQRAEAAGKPVLSLETPRDQLRLFDQLPREMQGEFLLRTLKETAGLEAELDALVAAWKGGDVAAVRRLVLDQFKPHPGLYERLVVRRNRNWLPQIESFLDDRRDYLVIVGAAHLVGDQGLVEMLRRRGHTVTQQ